MQHKIKIVITACIVCLLAVLFIIAIQHITEDTSLSERQIASRVEALYGGVVDNTIKQDDVYFVTFSTAQATYEVTVDEVNGRFSNLTLLYEQPTVAQDDTKEEEITPAPDAEEQPDSQVEPSDMPTTDQKPILLTEQQVISIASTQFTGEVEDIDFENTADGGYYLVEIDTAEEEVTVQIHAITGKILSVSFDD
ncbi:MAG: PepSY domain-containing protein [Lysinibacillus sp.]